MIFHKGKLLEVSYSSFIKEICKNQIKVFTNGVFDILHVGHIRYLKQASSFGNLIVAINSNESVKRLNKVGQRPIVDELERAEIVSCLYFVNYVIIFQEDTPQSLIKEIKPDFYIKGGDYNIEDLPEYKLVQSYGGKILEGLLVDGKSTTNIIKKLN